jgi:putative transposase
MAFLKQEFMIDKYHQDLSIMKEVVRNAIIIYNQKRPHYSNHMLTPVLMHLQNKIAMKTYKTKNRRKDSLSSV